VTFGIATPYVVAVFLVLLFLAGVAAVIKARWEMGLRKREHAREERLRNSSPRWCSVKDLRPTKPGEPTLLVEDPNAIDPSRLYLGVLANSHVANLPYRSVMCLAPTGAGKTPRVAVPMLLRHHGPALATSIKADLVHLTRHRREALGPVWYFDITNATGLANCCWSPLAGIETYGEALRAARWLTKCSKVEQESSGDKAWWDKRGEALIAPMLFAAARTGRHISAVYNWVQSGGAAEDQVSSILADLGDADARASWKSTMSREAKMKDSIYATAESLLEPFGNPDVRERLTVRDPDAPEAFTPAKLLDSGGTLYLLGTIDEQSFYAPVIESLVNAIVRELQLRSHKLEQAGLPPKEPLFALLDEAANICSPRDLPEWASAGAGMGLKLATFWQDTAQIDKVYGETVAETVVANHTTKLYLPGIENEKTLKALSTAIGDHRIQEATHQSQDRTELFSVGNRSSSRQWRSAELAPVSWLRERPAGTAFGLTRSTKVMRLRLPGWWEDPALSDLIPEGIRDQINGHYAVTK
jgi:type IV secretion system protein VirD4